MGREVRLPGPLSSLSKRFSECQRVVAVELRIKTMEHHGTPIKSHEFSW